MNEIITINTSPSATKITVSREKYELVPETHSILKKKVEKFDFNNPEVDPEELSGRLIETLKGERAYGLAAPQCGLPYRVFVAGYEDEYITMFNPELIYTSEEQLHIEEGCLSFPFLILSISRPKTIGVRYQDVKGKVIESQMDGLSARVVQHELDHLNGVTFDTIVKPLALKMGNKRRSKLTKKYARHLVASRKYVNN